MSLINDAIKKANQVNKERTPADPSPGASVTAGMQSADARHHPVPAGSMPAVLIVAGIVVFVLLGGTLLFLSLRDSPLTTDLDDAPARTSVPAVAPAVSSPAPEPMPAVNPGPRFDPIASVMTNPVPTPVTGLPPVVAATPAPPAVPAGPRPFPELKLQGIYYRLSAPSVMISGKTLMIGDIIADARVIQIERKEVTLELDGQQKVLRLQ